MYFLSVVAKTIEQNDEHGLLGETYVCCWVDAKNQAGAEERAHAAIAKDHWEVIRTDEIGEVTLEDYDADDESREYFQQAEIDGCVLLFNTCPKFPVYFMVAEVQSASGDEGANEARVWISNEIVAENDDDDPIQPDFWTGKRLDKVMEITTATLAANDYELVRVIKQNPCEPPDENSEECQFFDDAEEDGLCVVLVQDER